MKSHDGRRDCRIEAVGLAEHWHFHKQVTFILVCGGQALAFVADQQEAGLFVIGIQIIGVGLETGPDELALA